MIGRRSVGVVLLVSSIAGDAVAQSGGAAAARDQYRLARRLAAERSAGADEAFAKVIALDPTGALADDALVDRALLRGLASWPEDLGRVPASTWSEVGPWLEAAAAVPGADRAIEARLLLALSRVEPLPGRDGDGARKALLALASEDATGVIGARARYALGWLDRAEGFDDRARRAWTRVVADAPGSDAAARARTGIAALELAANRPGRAAVWAQSAVNAGEGPTSAATDLLRAAILDVGRGADPPRGFVSVAPLASAGRSISAMLGESGGGLLVADRREGSVIRFDSDGRASERWAIEEPTALGADPFGRVLLAAGGRLFVLEAAGVRPVADLGRFSSASSLTADASGRIFVLDRRGDRIGVLEPGSAAVVPLRNDRGTRLSAIASIGGRFYGFPSKGGAWLAISGSGVEERVAALPLESIASVCVDPAGRVAALDDETGALLVLTGRGTVVDRLDVRNRGVEKPSLVACGPDGSIVVLDAATGTIWRVGG